MEGGNRVSTASTGRSSFECDFVGCGKAFPKLWRLKEHQCTHTGEVGVLINVLGSGSSCHVGTAECSCAPPFVYVLCSVAK